MKPITVLVITEGGLRAARLEAALRRDPGLQVRMGTVADLARSLDDPEPAIVLVAVPPARLPRVLQTLRDRSSHRAVILLVAEPSRAWSAQTRQAGVQAVLREDTTAAELSAAIAAAAAGLLVLHPEALQPSPAPPSVSSGASGSTALTPREVEILEAMAEGMSNRRIAVRLGISRYTVKFHVASILAKLSVASRTEAVTLGLRQGLITL